MKISRKIVILFVLVVFVVSYVKTFSFHKTQAKNIIPIASVTSSDHIRGNRDAEVTVVEYSDFECPDCQYFQPTLKKIYALYKDRVRFVVRPYPLPQHLNAEKEAEAAECIASLGGNDAYWKFSDSLFSKEKVTLDGVGFPLAQLVPLAQQAGVDTKRFEPCLNSDSFRSLINTTVANATKAGIDQLPSIVVIGKDGGMQLIKGNQPFSVFNQILERTLQ